MQRIVSLLIVLPVSILAVALAVANRKPVSVSLDPFSPDAPALSLDVPLFAVIFAALIVGVILGSVVTWVRQGRFRREVKLARREQRHMGGRAGGHAGGRMGEAQPSTTSSLTLPAPRT